MLSPKPVMLNSFQHLSPKLVMLNSFQHLSPKLVMLNSFQHLSRWRSRPEMLKQVQHDGLVGGGSLA